MQPNASSEASTNELADDLLEGADAIAAFLFGRKESRRKVYYLAECSRLPVFRLGSVLCARKSVLLTYIKRQEDRSLPQLRCGSGGESGTWADADNCRAVMLPLVETLMEKLIQKLADVRLHAAADVQPAGRSSDGCLLES